MNLQVPFIKTLLRSAIIVVLAASAVNAAGRPGRAEFSRFIDMLRSKNSRQIEQAVNEMGRHEELRYAPLYSAIVEAIRFMGSQPDAREYRYLELEGWLPAAATRANVADLFDRRLYGGIVGVGDSPVMCWMYERSLHLADTIARANALTATARLISELGSQFEIGEDNRDYRDIAAAARRLQPPANFSFRSVLKYRDLAVVRVIDAPEGGRATSGFELFLVCENGRWILLSFGDRWIT